MLKDLSHLNHQYLLKIDYHLLVVVINRDSYYLSYFLDRMKYFHHQITFRYCLISYHNHHVIPIS